jgi:hypothetical protein
MSPRVTRYEPGAARYLALGDFTFWALDIERLRYIAGFGRMGWVDGAALDALPPLGFDDERALWDAYESSDVRRDGSICSVSIATAPTGASTADGCARRSRRCRPTLARLRCASN